MWFTKISTLSPRDLRCLCLLGKYTDFGHGGFFSKVQPHPREQRLSSGNCVTESSDSAIPTVQRLVHCLSSVFSASLEQLLCSPTEVYITQNENKNAKVFILGERCVSLAHELSFFCNFRAHFWEVFSDSLALAKRG